METSQKRHPYNFGIKKLKQELQQGGMSKRDINRSVKIYKEKINERIAVVKAKMEKEQLDAFDSTKEKLNASN